MMGRAADILVSAFGSPIEVCRALEPHLEPLGVDQLIYEYAVCTHIGTAADPRHQVLTIDYRGARTGFD